AVRILRGEPNAGGRPQGEPEDMRLLYSDLLHERGNVVREHLRRVNAGRLIRLPGPTQINRDAAEVLRVVGDLERVAGIVGSQVGDKHQRFTAALLVVIQRDVAGLNFG